MKQYGSRFLHVKVQPKTIMKFKYVGTQPLNLAGVGLVQGGEIITVTDIMGVNLKANAPDDFILQSTAPIAPVKTTDKAVAVTPVV